MAYFIMIDKPELGVVDTLKESWRMKAKLIPLLFFIFLALFPFSFADFNDEVEAEIIDNQTIGYYQTNTCKISLIEFYFKNFQFFP